MLTTFRRERRVPITEANTTHPSGALGMAGMLLEIKKENLERLSTATAAILDLPKETSNRYEVNVPNDVKKLKTASLRLQEAQRDSQKDLMLTLILQTGTQNPRAAIRKPIEDGLVSISFE